MIDNPNPAQNQGLETNTPTPEESGGEGKRFSQEEVNRIISERLARERAKAEPSSEETREADLKAREARLSCREFIAENGYPAELLDILNTSDAEAFKAAVGRLDTLTYLPSKNRKPTPRIVARTGPGYSPQQTTAALLQDAFKPPKI